MRDGNAARQLDRTQMINDALQLAAALVIVAWAWGAIWITPFDKLVVWRWLWRALFFFLALGIVVIWRLLPSMLSPSGDDASGLRAYNTRKEKLGAYEQALLEQFRYQSERLTSINNWRDAFILAVIAGYGALAVAGLSQIDAVRRAFDNTGSIEEFRGAIGLACVLTAFVGLLILRRLATDRAHAVRALRSSLDLQCKLGASIARSLPDITAHPPVSPLSLGGQCTSDFIVVCLNAIPLTAATVLFHDEDLNIFLGNWGLIAAIWFTMALAEFLAYSIWVSLTAWTFDAGKSKPRGT